ncbi:winged helix-turn-helix domain-containing protein [Pseudomonas triticifolii]|uniref:winged helix-turn-helix domain-containing protein n=1 Tax=Pseudomonas triticifolii TaxID=2762592 RepID=UPI002E2C779C|nr:winged helix-turn-helix domain-containing protein [Pseudomonas triticifolii]
MGIPDFQSVMRPVLSTVQNGAPLPLNELRERVADQFQLTEDERKERLPSGRQTVINNRVGWARTYLNKAGLLCIPAKCSGMGDTPWDVHCSYVELKKIGICVPLRAAGLMPLRVTCYRLNRESLGGSIRQSVSG